ncbi:hypothetical protein C8R48DRAFT_623009, partial [Suillus tomentosus]
MTRDGILTYHIIDVRHKPGVNNTAADGLSRSFSTADPVENDGSMWTVSEDWEASKGIVQDILGVNTDNSEQRELTIFTDAQSLIQRFHKDPFFIDILRALTDLDQSKSVQEKRHARHQAQHFFIKDGKLWRMANSSVSRTHSRLECVTQDEAQTMAYQEHTTNSHWGRNLVKLRLLDKIFCPRLDRIITNTI